MTDKDHRQVDREAEEAKQAFVVASVAASNAEATAAASPIPGVETGARSTEKAKK